METRREVSKLVQQKRLIAAVVVLAAVLAVLVTHQHFSSAGTAQHSPAQDAAPKHYFSYGMNKKQVLRIIGRPKIIRENYWYYPVVKAKLAGKILVVVENTNIVIHSADQFRILWYAGQLQNEEVRFHPPGSSPRWTGIVL